MTWEINLHRGDRTTTRTKSADNAHSNPSMCKTIFAQSINRDGLASKSSLSATNTYSKSLEGEL